MATASILSKAANDKDKNRRSSRGSFNRQNSELRGYDGGESPSSPSPPKQGPNDAPNDDGSVDIAITSSAVAMYATFTTLAHGRFSDNAILLLPGATTIQFIPFGPLQMDALRTSLRVEHVATYLV